MVCEMERRVKGMKVIVCLDDALGMMFNRRRQSRDKKVIEDMCSTTNTLRIAPFSESLFRGMSVGLTVDEQFLEQADCESVCFLENQSLLQHSSESHTGKTDVTAPVSCVFSM